MRCIQQHDMAKDSTNLTRYPLIKKICDGLILDVFDNFSFLNNRLMSNKDYQAVIVFHKF